MKNRDRYITNVCEFDMLLNINYEIMDGKKCIIEAITNEYQYDDNKNRCFSSSDRNCSKCIQKWLNAEGE